MKEALQRTIFLAVDVAFVTYVAYTTVKVLKKIDAWSETH